MAKSVLVVDDEQGYRDMYVYLLEPLGIEVTCVENGRQALEKIQAKAYDLILTDVHMPGMDGYEVFKKTKAIRPNQKIAIFSSSSDPNHERERKALKEGAVECLFKPMDISQIEKIMENL